MHVRLFHTGGGNTHKLRFGAHVCDGAATGVTHGGTHATHQLVHNVGQRAFNGDTAFNAFRYQLINAGFFVLEITVRRTLALTHGAQRTHATVRLIGTALEQFHFARGFVGTGQHRADHHHTGTGGNGFGDVARETDTTVSHHRNTVFFHRRRNIGDGRNLRHTNTGDDTGGTDGTRANANFHAVSTGFGQRNGGFSGGNVAANHLHFREMFFHPAHTVNNAGAGRVRGMAVSGVHHNHVNTGFYQCFNTLFGTGTGADGSADAQTTLVVFGGIGESAGFVDVFNGHQANQFALSVQHQNFFNAVDVQQLLHFFSAGAFRYGDQFLF